MNEFAFEYGGDCISAYSDALYDDIEKDFDYSRELQNITHREAHVRPGLISVQWNFYGCSEKLYGLVCEELIVPGESLIYNIFT